MTTPGTVVTLRETPSVLSLPTDTGTAFIVGLTDRGPLTAKLIRSLDEFVSVYGARQSYSVLYDAIELYFREGGDRAYLGRAVGPGATSGTRNLVDGVAATSLVVTAIGPGAWSANYKVAVVAGTAGGTYKIQVTDAANVVLEDSGDLATQDAAVQWAQASSQYIRIAIGASALNPVPAAATALSAGTDDRTNITDTQWLNALNLFPKDLGPGQVFAPGRTSATGQGQLITHAEANGRVAILDMQDTGTVGTLTAAAAALANSRMAAPFTPWIVIPGLATAVGSTRTVPPSALIAGLVARNDPSFGPNRPAAGNAGQSRYAIGLSQVAFTDTNRGTLNDNSINVIRGMFGGFRVYGWRSLADPVTDSGWVDFGNGRLYMSLASELNAVGENYVFDEIDGQNGVTIGSFHDALAGVLLEHYNRGELFGDEPEDAFSVDTGSSVNTLVTIAANQLKAVCSVKMSPMAEIVRIEIVKRLVSEVL